MRKINTKVSKRIATIVLATAAAFSLMGCSVEKNFTTTETHTYTDANGNTTTTTTTNHNGEVTTETTSSVEDTVASEDENEVEMFTEVPIEFANEMGWDVGSFSLKMSSADEWSDNLFSEEEYLDDGDTMTGLTVSYNSEDRFIDLSVADSQGDGVEFTNIELPVDNVDQILVTLHFDQADGSYYATVD